MPDTRVNWILSGRLYAGPQVPSVARCAATIVVLKIAVATLGLGRVIRWLKSRSATVPTAEQTSTDCVAAFEYAVAMAAAFCPFRAKCLEQSLTLFYLARRVGIPVTYHHGVQPTPFEAHAWVEYQGRIINDVAEHVAFYRRFPQICP